MQKSPGAFAGGVKSGRNQCLPGSSEQALVTAWFWRCVDRDNIVEKIDAKKAEIEQAKEDVLRDAQESCFFQGGRGTKSNGF